PLPLAVPPGYRPAGSVAETESPAILGGGGPAMTVAPRALGLLLAAAAAALPGAGCAALENFTGYFEASSARRARVFGGSVDTVAGRVSAHMRDLGFVTELQKDPKTQAVRILCTNAGTRFALVLTRELKEVGEQTRLKIEWDGPADEQTGGKVLAS